MTAEKKQKNEKPSSFKTMEEEVEYLRMENAYLKQLNAIVEEEKQKTLNNKKSRWHL
ncbi:transposase [Halobacillus massiliensis]|uniref:transposase n=1 Tax=Halobacillus massiliensis TaxID=1926286 RepID=UPI00117B6E85|nr:transposase [Halobacillus massiliensis]